MERSLPDDRTEEDCTADTQEKIINNILEVRQILMSVVEMVYFKYLL